MIVYDRDDLRYTAMTTPEGPATTMRNPLFLACLAALAMPGTALAQSAPLTLDRIFGDHAIATDHVEGGEWTADGRGYTAIEPSKEVKGGTDLVRYDVARNTRSVLVPARDLIVAATGKPIAIEGYAWSADGKRLLLFTNGTRFRRTRALGDYWLFDPATKQLRRIGGEVPPASLMYAEFSPDGSRIAYVRGNNLYVEPAAGDAPPRKLTQDGNELIVNGLGDWVYEEEFYLRKAWSWSPDSQRIAFWRFDTSGVGTFYMITNTVGQYSRPIPLQYPKVGTTNSAVRVGTVDVASGTTRWIALAGDPRQNYVPQMSWAGTGGTLILQYANRLQNTYQVLLADPARNRALIAEAVEVARGADMIILAIGDTEQTSREGFSANHLGDRTTLDLIGEQNALFEALHALGKPIVVTAINGPAVGAGLGLALLGDIMVMARSAYGLLAFVNIGLVPDAGSTWLVAQAVGRAKALEMALLGERLSAEDALAAGLITRIAEDDACLAEAQAIAARLAAGPVVAVGMIRKQVAAALTATLDETLAIERENQRAAGRTRDFAEAVRAFGEKRAPAFEGR